jgi:RHS repeat-associated protein
MASNCKIAIITGAGSGIGKAKALTLLENGYCVALGGCWESQGNLPAQQFTGQRLDSTGLYYYNARYYDPNIGRFISPDTIFEDPLNPQSLNRYSYCINNPLRYTDPSGHGIGSLFSSIVKTITSTVTNVVNTITTTVQSTYNTVSTSVATAANTVTTSVKTAASTVATAALNTVGITNITSIPINIPSISTTTIQAPVITVVPSSITDNIVLKSGIVDAIAITIPYVGIFTTVPNNTTVTKHESYHWAEQRTQGGASWLTRYLSEMGRRGVVYGALHVNNPWNNAYYFTHDEQQARAYAEEPIGDIPGPRWVKRFFGDQ